MMGTLTVYGLTRQTLPDRSAGKGCRGLTQPANNSHHTGKADAAAFSQVRQHARSKASDFPGNLLPRHSSGLALCVQSGMQCPGIPTKNLVSSDILQAVALVFSVFKTGNKTLRSSLEP